MMHLAHVHFPFLDEESCEGKIILHRKTRVGTITGWSGCIQLMCLLQHQICNKRVLLLFNKNWNTPTIFNVLCWYVDKQIPIANTPTTHSHDTISPKEYLSSYLVSCVSMYSKLEKYEFRMKKMTILYLCSLRYNEICFISISRSNLKFF